MSAKRLTAYLTGQQIQVHQFRIPSGGQWQPPTDAIAICGPRSSPTTAAALESDPFLSFGAEDAGRWAIRDRATGASR